MKTSSFYRKTHEKHIEVRQFENLKIISRVSDVEIGQDTSIMIVL